MMLTFHTMLQLIRRSKRIQNIDEFLCFAIDEKKNNDQYLKLVDKIDMGVLHFYVEQSFYDTYLFCISLFSDDFDWLNEFEDYHLYNSLRPDNDPTLFLVFYDAKTVNPLQIKLGFEFNNECITKIPTGLLERIFTYSRLLLCIRTILCFGYTYKNSHNKNVQKLFYTDTSDISKIEIRLKITLKNLASSKLAEMASLVPNLNEMMEKYLNKNGDFIENNFDEFYEDIRSYTRKLLTDAN